MTESAGRTGDVATSPVIALVGALDTKGTEYGHLRDRFRRLGAQVIVIDTGVLGEATLTPDVARGIVAERGGGDLADLVRDGQRNAGMKVMARGATALVAELVEQRQIHAVMAIGGSNAAYVMAECCAALPLGFPKVLVSTITSGDTRMYVRDTDLTMINPVVDINGLNRITRPVLDNAVDACLGMATTQASEPDRGADSTMEPLLVGITMFGVTTAVGTAVQQGLDDRGLESVSFHCTGVGGATMENLIRAGAIQAVADLTTTELADDLVGGDCSAGPDRLTAAAEQGIPQVVSVGALDMINFWGRPVPEEFAHRTLLAHNPTVTLMRTDIHESAELGRRLAAKLNRSTGPVAVLFPRAGLSELSVPGGPFADPEADEALLAALRDHLRDDIDLHEFNTHINDPAIAAAAIELLTGWLQEERP